MVAFACNRDAYTLPLDGWVEAQSVSGCLESEDFDRRTGRLCQAMKDAVKGRAEEQLLEVREVAERAGLPKGWVCNILEAALLERSDPKGRDQVRFENGLVWIPVTFGQEPVDLA